MEQDTPPVATCPMSVTEAARELGISTETVRRSCAHSRPVDATRAA
jgi:hypothetical protein